MIESENINNIIDEAKEYTKAKIELTKLEATEKLSEGMAKSVSFLIIGAFIILFLFIFSIFLALLIGDQMKNHLYGFGIVSLTYIFIISILFFFRHKLLKSPIQNSIIRQLFKGSEDYEQ